MAQSFDAQPADAKLLFTDDLVGKIHVTAASLSSPTRNLLTNATAIWHKG